MNLINRQTKEIKLGTRRRQRKYFISVKGNTVFFTSMVSQFCEIKEGVYIHFMNDEKEWRFFIDDNSDGFVPTLVCKNYKLPSFRINSSALVSMILKSTGFNKEKRFSIVKTNIMHDKCPVFRLSTENVSTDIK